jgi:hypothetical protein
MIFGQLFKNGIILPEILLENSSCEQLIPFQLTLQKDLGGITKKDKVLFYRYAYGSIQESLDWILKAHMRKLISDEQYKDKLEGLKNLPQALHRLIKFTDEKLKH